MKEKLISICILSYNHKNFVENCIGRILEQKYINTEIIVLDDGSNDGTQEYIINNLNKLTQKKSNFISQENTGNVPMNMNKLLQNANGEFIYVTSMDDMLCDSLSLQKMAALISKNENIQFCSSDRSRIIDDQNQHIGEEVKSIFYGKKSHEITVEQLFKSEIEDAGSFFVQGSLYRKSILEAVGGWDEDMLGDDIVIRTKIYRYMMLNPSMKFEIINDYIFDYRHHETNLHKNVERQLETVFQVQGRYGNNLKCNQIYPWTMHGIKQYFQKIQYLINHDANKDHRVKMITEVLDEYIPIYLKYINNYKQTIDLVAKKSDNSAYEEIARLQAIINSMTNSKIWRFSLPIRLIDKSLKFLLRKIL
jgi:alpha-1,3-rhamnosyltransferase